MIMFIKNGDGKIDAIIKEEDLVEEKKATKEPLKLKKTTPKKEVEVKSN